MSKKFYGMLFEDKVFISPVGAYGNSPINAIHTARRVYDIYLKGKKFKAIGWAVEPDILGVTAFPSYMKPDCLK